MKAQDKNSEGLFSYFSKTLRNLLLDSGNKNTQWEISRTLPFQKKPMLIDGTRSHEVFTMRRYRVGQFEYRPLTKQEWLDYEEGEAL